MTNQTWESEFERELCEHLAANGWLYSPDDTGYDVQRALYPEDLFAWLEETQPDELAKKIKPSMTPQAQAKARDAILHRVAGLLDKGQAGAGGTLQLLRGGFKDTPATFTLMQKRPEQSVNQAVNDRYQANRLRVMRQVHYSAKHPHKSIDLVLFVNGLPVATLELKTDHKQTVGDAKKQYQTDRDPAGEPLLGFGTRALVHFAVSNDEVWMTTKLAKDKTYFLPFNRGNAGHQGNGPDEDDGSATTYLWRDVFQRDQWLDVLGKFMHYEKEVTEDEHGRKHTDHKLIFPRFHQLDVVTKIVADAKANGAGQRYLIQHSAGSGKTRSIAWAAHRLATLHDDANQKVFDTVIVVTDRNVLDAQLQEAITQIEAKQGVVATISSKEAAKKSFNSKSAYLTQTLTSGKLIIVVTIQTFPFVLEAIQENKALAGRKFVVIADEAHSSQTGQTAAKLKQVLSDQEAADLDDGGTVDVEAILAAEARAKADTRNITFLAFTATPKAKTMEMFGTMGDDGLPRPFHTYTMAQAIEENFILDVLKNYTTYSTAFELAKKVTAGQMAPVQKTDSNGMLVDESVATKGLMRWVKLHPTNITQKVQVIIEHFEANVKHLLDGRAKAMVVTDSRKAAVRYKLAMEKYIAKRGYQCLVAFSGPVEDPESGPKEFTEASMNPGVGDLREAFTHDEYRVMIVANKFQTGFDQPLLCAMYVDRQLSGVTAVQTLSRLNRYVRGKETMILDFVNSEDDILAAFKPYYEEAEIVATTDPNLIHDLQTKLDTSGHYSAEELDDVVEAVVKKLGNGKLSGAIQPVKARFVAAWNAAQASSDKAAIEELDLFRKDVTTYVRLHDFMSQLLDFEDSDVEKHAVFFRHLLPHLRTHGETVETVDLSDVELVHIRQKEVGQHSLDLAEGEKVPLVPASAAGSKKLRDPKLVLLDELIERLNAQFAGEDFRDDQVSSWASSLVEAMKADEDLREQASVNSQDQFLGSPTLREALLLAVAETNEAHSRMTELFNEKGAVEKAMLELLGKLLYMELHDGDGTPE